MKLTVARFSAVLLALAWPALPALAAGVPGVVEGRLTQISTTSIQIDHARTYQFNPVAAQCFDFRGDAMTCDTLIGIGYVDHARVSLRGSTVVRIDIVELQQ